MDVPVTLEFDDSSPSAAPAANEETLTLPPVLSAQKPAMTPAVSGLTWPPTPPAPAELILQHVESRRQFIVRTNWTVGRHDATSGAEVKLSGVPGCEEVHREHCRFEMHAQTWYVLPINQREIRGQSAFTNHTYVNGKVIPPGRQEPVRNGDTVTLSNVSLTIHFINEGK
jgi:hypothetical protein